VRKEMRMMMMVKKRRRVKMSILFLLHLMKMKKI